MDLTGISALLIAELTGVSVRTATRWKNKNELPPTAEILLAMKLTADLGVHAKAWRGFRIADGLLWTPENQKVGPHDIRAIPYRRHQIREYELELARPRQFILL
jgi:transcriptional regulator with XRE-family HTH domain